MNNIEIKLKDTNKKVVVECDAFGNFVIAKVKTNCPNAERLAYEISIKIRPLITVKYTSIFQTILIVVDTDKKVVILCSNNHCKDWIYMNFDKASSGETKPNKDIASSAIIGNIINGCMS